MFICSSISRLSTQSKMSETRIRSERERNKDAMRRLSVTDEKSIQKKNRSFILSLFELEELIGFIFKMLLDSYHKSTNNPTI